MPELPEVEVTRRGLLPHVVGQSVQQAIVRHHGLRWPVDPTLPQLLQGGRIVDVARRGKYLLLRCEKPEGVGTSSVSGWLLIHLGMTGTLRVLPDHEAAGAHDHLDLQLTHGLVRFRDPRRFGAVLWHADAQGPIEHHPLLLKLGVEPLEAAFAGVLGGRLLYRNTRGRRVPIKQILLAGSLVVGVGNIYASESLFRAGIHPATQAGRIGLARYQKLAQAIRETLQEAIARGGSSLRDFVGSDGASGYFQLDCLVYDRAGLPCRRCHAPIRQMVQSQRSTYFCPVCQRV